MKKVHETTTLLLVTLPNIQRLKKFTGKLSSKPFLIWLLTTPPHLKYVAILPCNLLFSDINVSKVVWQRNERNGGIFNNQFTANIPMNLAVKIF